MKIKKVLAVIAITIMILGMISINSLAATFNLNVTFDGKTMKLYSDDLALNALNILPGEIDTSVINIENKGNEKVELYVTAKIVDDQSLLDILDVTVTNLENKEVFKGKYDKFEKIKIELEKGEKEALTIKTSMPESAGNEYQNKQANIKFTFEANGEGTPEEITPEPTPVAPQTNQSRVIIYSVLVGIAVILMIALLYINLNKNKKNNK